MGKVTIRKESATLFTVAADGIGIVTGVQQRWTKNGNLLLKLPDGEVIDEYHENYEVFDLDATEASGFDSLLELLEILRTIGFANFKTGEAAPGTLDETPTSGSTNGVESGGVFNALADKYSTSNPSGYQTSSDVASALSTAAVGILNDRGNHDASGNVFPSTGGSGTSGAIKKGNIWTVSVAGTLGGVAVTIGDVVRALVDSPGQTAGNWVVTENNIGYVAENSINKSTSIVTDQASNAKYASVKAIFDWATSVFTTASAVASQITTALSGYATQSFVTSQGYITNVITALGYTPRRKTTAATGSVIAFDVPLVYNSIASPSSSNITDNLTGAEIGNIQKIYHNSGTAPTFPAGWVRRGNGTYTTSVLNIIYAEWSAGTTVEYWITQ